MADEKNGPDAGYDGGRTNNLFRDANGSTSDGGRQQYAAFNKALWELRSSGFGLGCMVDGKLQEFRHSYFMPGDWIPVKAWGDDSEENAVRIEHERTHERLRHAFTEHHDVQIAVSFGAEGFGIVAVRVDYRAGGGHGWYHRSLVPAICHNHRHLGGDFLSQCSDPEPGAERDAAASAAGEERRAPAAVLQRVQCRIRKSDGRLPRHLGSVCSTRIAGAHTASRPDVPHGHEERQAG